MSARLTLGDRDRRALRLGAWILLPALFFVYGVKPYFASLETSRDALAAERLALARERAAVQAAVENPGMQQLADSLVRVMAPRLFAGRDDVIATAELVSHLGEVAREHDVWLQNAITRPSEVGEAGVRTLHVAVRAESDLQGVLRFLRALESGEKLIRVERLDISVTPNIFSETGIEPVTVSATITGYAMPGVTP